MWQEIWHLSNNCSKKGHVAHCSAVHQVAMYNPTSSQTRQGEHPAQTVRRHSPWVTTSDQLVAATNCLFVLDQA